MLLVTIRPTHGLPVPSSDFQPYSPTILTIQEVLSVFLDIQEPPLYFMFIQGYSFTSRPTHGLPVPSRDIQPYSPTICSIQGVLAAFLDIQKPPLYFMFIQG